MLDFSRFEYLTFDCYGTLIDWETGILAAFGPVLNARGLISTPAISSELAETVLEWYGDLEAHAEAGEYKLYKEVLREVVRGIASRLDFTPSSEEENVLVSSLKHWPPFPDTVDALKQLATRYKLAVISNTDNDLFAETARTLQVPFAQVITAEMARSYKPSLNNFELALDIIPVCRQKILHAAQSLYHDIGPAKFLGISNVWVNRRAGKLGLGATAPATATPDLEVPSLRSLAEMIRRQLGTGN